MSWRFIFVVLAIAAGAAAWGGVRLGDWLVAHGPQQAPVAAEPPELSAVPVLDANGRPYVAQPPQPLVDGRLAVPEAPTEIAWQIPNQSLTETDNPVIDLATTTITMTEAEQIAAAGNQRLVGIADVGDLGLSANGQGAQPIQPIETAPPPTTITPRPAANASWQASLRQDIQACSALSFFDRPSCAWAARNKYCEPNRAWGQVRDCPAKSF
ncbi:MAG TPA: hypothetical protein VIP51_14860 [Eoetvoesiella sp.]